MGGEWGLGASLALETLPIEARGLYSGIYQEGMSHFLEEWLMMAFMQQHLYSLLMKTLSLSPWHFLGYACGYLLATLVNYAVQITGSSWRILFWAGSAFSLVGIFIRFCVPESDTFEKTKEARKVMQRSFFKDIWYMIKNHYLRGKVGDWISLDGVLMHIWTSFSHLYGDPIGILQLFQSWIPGSLSNFPYQATWLHHYSANRDQCDLQHWR